MFINIIISHLPFNYFSKSAVSDYRACRSATSSYFPIYVSDLLQY